MIYEPSRPLLLHVSFNFSAFILNVAFAAIVTEIKSIIHLDLHVGMHMDMHVGEHLDIHTGDHTQIENFHTNRHGHRDVTVRALKNEITGGHMTLDLHRQTRPGSPA